MLEILKKVTLLSSAMALKNVAKKIVYLLGAGATHAEVLNLAESPSETFRRKNGLLISNVSKRVMEQAQKFPSFKKGVEFVTAAEGSLNIELLISLIASNRIHEADRKVNLLKVLVQSDIEKVLTKTRKKKFYLHRALIEFHGLLNFTEQLLGMISLNYDDVLDEAYRDCKGTAPNYCHRASVDERWPVLKLHGSFSWSNLRIYKRRRGVSIIPLGINKNYLSPPYNFIWSKAFDILAQCDVLRIIGCSLNQNDLGLIDLLFKAHLERPFAIEIIDFQNQGDQVKNNYGFFPNIVKPKDIEGGIMAVPQIESEDHTGNPFKIWLRGKAERSLLEANIRKTTYLRKCSLR